MKNRLIWKTFIYTVAILFIVGLVISNLSYLKNNQNLRAENDALKSLKNEKLAMFDMRLSKLESTTGIGNANYEHLMLDLKNGQYAELDKKINELPENMTELQEQEEVEKHGLQHYSLSDESYIYPITIKDTFVSSEMGRRNIDWSPNHTGLDFVNNKELNIFSPKSGIVIERGFDASSDGNYIIIQHNPIERSLLCHAYNFNVKKGDKVIQGQDIGTIGNTGNTTGQHLHWTMEKLIEGHWRVVNPVKDTTYNKQVFHGMGWGVNGWYYF